MGSVFGRGDFSPFHRFGIFLKSKTDKSHDDHHASSCHQPVWIFHPRDEATAIHRSKSFASRMNRAVKALMEGIEPFRSAEISEPRIVAAPNGRRQYCT
jgi:hypothetical protein